MFQKYLVAFWVLVGLQVIVILTVIIHALMPGSPWLFEIVNKWSVFRGVFTFVANQAEIISIIIVVLALALLYLSFRKRDRGPTRNRLHDWATDAVVTLSQYRQQRSQQDFDQENFEELHTILIQLAENSRNIASDARVFDSELRERIKTAIDLLQECVKKSGDKDISVFADTQFLQLKLTDIMLSTYQSD